MGTQCKQFNTEKAVHSILCLRQVHKSSVHCHTTTNLAKQQEDADMTSLCEG
jgi:hypothetical protein